MEEGEEMDEGGEERRRSSVSEKTKTKSEMGLGKVQNTTKRNKIKFSNALDGNTTLSTTLP